MFLLRCITLALLVLLPVYKVYVLKARLRPFRKDGRTSVFPAQWHQLLEEYKPETYIPEARPLVDRLVGWAYVQIGATVLAAVGFIAWELIDPILP